VTVFYCFDAKMTGELPSWFIIASAFSYLCARVLDEMDGKQARRTGNSSPLGLLIDHGCDTYTAGFMSMIMMKIVQLDNFYICLTLMFTSFATFYLNMLEEYYVGEFILQIGNLSTDGSLMLFITFLVTGILGNNFWLVTVSINGTDIMLKELYFYIYFPVQVVVLTSLTLQTVNKCKEDRGQAQLRGGRKFELGPFVNQIVWVIMTPLIYFFVYYRVPEIDRTPRFDFTFLLHFLLIFVHITNMIIFAHITHSEYSPLNKIFVWNTTALIINALF